MGFFKNAVKDFASRKTARKLKTAITRKGEDGSITLTVKGVVCTDAEEMAAKAEEYGLTMSGKGGDFEAAEGTVGGALVDSDAADFLTEFVKEDGFSEAGKPKPKRKPKPKTDDEDEEDTATDKTEATVTA